MRVLEAAVLRITEKYHLYSVWAKFPKIFLRYIMHVKCWVLDLQVYLKIDSYNAEAFSKRTVNGYLCNKETQVT